MVSTVTVHAYDWVIKDNYGDEGQMNIHCWALDKQSRPYLIRIIDYCATCYVELPLFVNGKRYQWNNTKAMEFYEELCKTIGYNAPIKGTFKNMKKLYYYRQEKTYPMLLLNFTSWKAAKNCAYKLQDPLKTDRWGWLQCNAWEYKISPVRKLLTLRKIRYSQWFNIDVITMEDDYKISSCQFEYIGDWTSMTGISPEETKSWTTSPGILAFDIECYSDNHRAMPIKYEAKHVAYMISCIYQKYGDKSSRKRYAIIVGDCNEITNLDHCILYRVNNELEMVEKFAQIVEETDPIIITGYNILGFDYPYLNTRVKRTLNEWPVMGKLLGEKSVMTTRNWSSGAYGHQDINTLQTEGRISVDMLPIIRRDFKLPKYDLNTVAKEFIGKEKHDISAPEMFRIYEALITAQTEEEIEQAKIDMTRVMAYCIQDSELVIDLMEKVGVWIALVEMSSIVGVTIVEIFTRGQQLRCLSQLYDLSFWKGYVLDERDIAGSRFTGGYVFEPVPGIYDNVICLDFASLYPSIMQAYNICYTTLVPPELEDIIPEDQCNVIEFEQEEPISETVHHDIVEDVDLEEADLEEADLEENIEIKTTVTKYYRYLFYKGTEDNKFEGLIPQLVRNLVTERRAVRKNIAPNITEISALKRIESLKGIDISSLNLEKELEVLNQIEEPGFKRTYQEYRVKLAQDPNFIKEIELGSIERMKRVSELELDNLVIDKRQNALKVSANSFFGFLGVHNDGGLKPLPEGAKSITACGRILIGEVEKYIKDTYQGKTVYGDTDSVMMQLPCVTNAAQCNYWGHRLAQEINGVRPGEKDCDDRIWPEGKPGLFLAPLAMEFEKAMRILCFKKKKYAALFIDKDGSFKTNKIFDKNGQLIGEELIILLRGIILARRDNFSYLRETYRKLLEMALTHAKFTDMIDLIIDKIQLLITGQIDPRRLLIIKGLGAVYKNENYFMKVFADDLQKAGKPVSPGDRLDYLIVEVKDEPLLGHRMKLLDQYLESQNTDNPMKIDYLYYIKNLMSNCIDQLISTCYKEEINKLENVGYKASNRHKLINLSQITIMIYRMLSNGLDINPIKDMIRINDTKPINDYVSNSPRKIKIRRIKEAVKRTIIIRK